MREHSACEIVRHVASCITLMDFVAASPLDEAATANPKHSEAPGGQDPRGVASYVAGGHGQEHDAPWGTGG